MRGAPQLRVSDPVVGVCDLSEFGASVVMDIMRIQPVLIVGGMLQEIPFNVPPVEFLVELRERRRSIRAS